MPPKIWGFNLGEISWGAFSSRRMFSDRWHLRSERFGSCLLPLHFPHHSQCRVVVYQLAMLICLAAECTATYSLSKYEKLQTNVQNASPGALLHNNDIISAQIVTIVFCVLVATIFGADFFFLLFFPRREYPAWYNASRKACAIVIACGLAAATIMSTVIVARNSAFITGVSQSEAESLTQTFSRPPLRKSS